MTRPQLAKYLRGFSAQEKPLLFRELLETELEIRRTVDNPKPIDAYLNEFPEFSKQIEHAFQPKTQTKNPTRLWFEGLLGSNPAARSSRSLMSAVPQDVLDDNLAEQTFGPGEVLLRQGDAGTNLMVVREGTVEIAVVDTSGKAHIIDRSISGDVLGEMSLLTGQPCTANVTALSDVRVLSMSIERFHELARRYPELSIIMTNLVADRLGKPGRDALADKTLDRYRIKRRLGRGGMGVVYEATDTDTHERVALKMMSHRLVYSTDALHRFRQEAEIIERFDHPHIIRSIRNFAAFHTYFIAMEFFDGKTLQQELADHGPFSTERFSAHTPAACRRTWLCTPRRYRAPRHQTCQHHD